jgi:hypothetical protein
MLRGCLCVHGSGGVLLCLLGVPGRRDRGEPVWLR